MAFLNKNPHTSRSEYLLIAITGTVAAIIVIGGISAIVYIVLKKSRNPVAGKRALQCYSVVVFLLALVQMFQFKSTIRKRDRAEFLEQFNQYLTAFIYTKIDNSQYPGIDEDILAANVDLYIRCITIDIEHNKNLLDRLIEAEDKIHFLQNDAAFKEVEEYCIGYIQRNP